MDLVSIPLLLIGWFSSSIRMDIRCIQPKFMLRLHFVEWMRQYYDSSGEEFRPFGLKSRYVEVE